MQIFRANNNNNNHFPAYIAVIFSFPLLTIQDLFNQTKALYFNKYLNYKKWFAFNRYKVKIK